MERVPINVDVEARVSPQDPSLGSVNTVEITRPREIKEFLVDDSDNTVTSFETYPDSCLPNLRLQLKNFEPDYVFQHLNNKLHDLSLSRKVCDQIVFEARKSSQEPLSMTVSVKLTHNVYIVVPGNNSTDYDQDLESEICAICLESLSESGLEETKPICGLPHCAHLFHEVCFLEWLDRDNNSCPLCREAVY